MMKREQKERGEETHGRSRGDMRVSGEGERRGKRKREEKGREGKRREDGRGETYK